MAFNNPVVGGEHGQLIRESIQSPDYVAGTSGWTINRDGSAEFNNVTIRLDLTTGSITVGPDNGPQVVIRISNGAGLIQFPTNSGWESLPPQIVSEAIAGTQQVSLNLDSGFASNGSSSDATLNLYSGNDSTATPATAVLGAYSPTGVSEIWLYDTSIDLDSALVESKNEFLASYNNPDANYPMRITKGKSVTVNTITTLALGVDTLVSTANTNTVYLENGKAYAVEVQISTRSSVGTSAAGTQVVLWKLWDGAVGGTQLGQSVQKTNGSVGTIANSDTFRFVFQFTGTTGTRTLNLSGNKTSGTDTFQAIMNTASYVLVTKIGDPAKIQNL